MLHRVIILTLEKYSLSKKIDTLKYIVPTKIEPYLTNE